MKIAITGASGRVGGALVEHFHSRGFEVIALTREQLDLSALDFESKLDPGWDVMLNPAAMASPDLCEQNPDAAQRVNAQAPAKLAAWAARNGVRFLHFSTDYVFSGDRSGKIALEEIPTPRTVYGISKREGEIAVLAANPQAIVARISWIYGATKHGFVDSVLARLLRGEPITAICDKFSLPTHMKELAGWIESLLASPARGIVHACHRGEPVSWHGIAEEIAATLKKHQALPASATLSAQTLAEQSTFLAARPIHTAMDCISLEQWIGPVSEWKTALHRFVCDAVTTKKHSHP